jgi:selenoprotein W-related protein
VLSTFSLEMGEVSLIPGTGGIFEIHLDGELVWERKRDGGFPDAKQIKQLVRDRIDPGRDLGHIDHPHGPAARHGHT